MSDLLSKPSTCALDVLVVLGTVELVVFWDKAVVEVVQPGVTDSTQETCLVKYVGLDCHTLQDFHTLVALVAAVCSNH